MCCGRHCVSPHSELLTWDALKGTSRESAFSLLLLGTSCPGSSWEPVTSKGRTHSNKVSACQTICCVDCVPGSTVSWRLRCYLSPAPLWLLRLLGRVASWASGAQTLPSVTCAGTKHDARNTMSLQPGDEHGAGMRGCGVAVLVRIRGGQFRSGSSLLVCLVHPLLPVTRRHFFHIWIT